MFYGVCSVVVVVLVVVLVVAVAAAAAAAAHCYMVLQGLLNLVINVNCFGIK